MGKAARDTMEQTAREAGNGGDRAKETVHSLSETVSETAQTAANLSSRVAEQGREVAMAGMRTAAGIGSQVADIGFGRGHHLISASVHAMDVYRDASERSAERVQALFTSAMTLGRGIQDMQHAWLEMLDQSMEHAVHKPQDLLRCKSVVELAEVQRDLYLDSLNHAFESTSRLLDMAGRAAQQAMRPLQGLH